MDFFFPLWRGLVGFLPRGVNAHAWNRMKNEETKHEVGNGLSPEAIGSVRATVFSPSNRFTARKDHL